MAKVVHAQLRKPPWLKKKISYTDERHRVKKTLHTLSLNTVCESARCPNLSECFHHQRATFLILGNICSRGCSFCSVRKVQPGEKIPVGVDKDEPSRIAKAVDALNLKYVVITSVTRDDLSDGGAGQFAETIRKIRDLDNDIKIEVLTPDFQGDRRAIDTVAKSGPDVYNHNIETVPRLYVSVRPQALYERSLFLLKHLKQFYPGILLKSGIMVGLGETKNEVIEVLKDLSEAGCDAVTIGQYLRPSHRNITVAEYVRPEIFEFYKEQAKKIGFSFVASGPYVRSSYMAHEGYENLAKKF
jgi:lipoic acid synthetase